MFVPRALERLPRLAFIIQRACQFRGWWL